MYISTDRYVIVESFDFPESIMSACREIGSTSKYDGEETFLLMNEKTNEVLELTREELLEKLCY